MKTYEYLIGFPSDDGFHSTKHDCWFYFGEQRDGNKYIGLITLEQYNSMTSLNAYNTNKKHYKIVSSFLKKKT